MNKKSASQLKYQAILQEFLDLMEWKDELDVNTEESKVSLSTGISLAEESSARMWIDADDKSDQVGFFIYYEFTCKKSKFQEMDLLLAHLHRRWKFGRFEMLDDGRVRWSHLVDFEGSEPTGLTIQRNVGPGWEAMNKFLSPIIAVALTKQSAAEALAELDEADEAAERDSASSQPDEDVPTEL